MQAALVVIVLLLLLIPLHRLTDRAASGTAVISPPSSTKHAQLSIRSTAAPFRFQIEFLGKVLWAESSSSPELSKEVDIDFPKEGIDLAVDGSWDSQELVALEVSVSLPDGATLEKTLWGRGRISDVITLKEE